MSQNSSETNTEKIKKTAVHFTFHKWWMVFILPAWIAISFYIAQKFAQLLLDFLLFVNIALDSLNSTVVETIMTMIVYIVTIMLVIGLPYVTKKYQTSWSEIGINRYPLWKDILITPAGLIIYYLFSAILLFLMTKLWPGFNIEQVQKLGFNNLVLPYQYILAFISLVVIAPIAEEILFRGYLFGKLKKIIPIWLAIIITSLVFGVFHLVNSGNSGVLGWNLAIDTFALSVILCLLRVFTDSLWASILLHMVKNGTAYYIVFISPLLLVTLGK